MRAEDGAPGCWWVMARCGWGSSERKDVFWVGWSGSRCRANAHSCDPHEWGTRTRRGFRVGWGGGGWGGGRETPHVSDDEAVANMGHPMLIFGFAPELVEEEVACALGVGFGFGGGVEVHDLPLGSFFAGGVVGGPVGKAGAVGVAGAGEVGPVGADLFGELAVFGTPDGFGAGVEGAEDVFDVVGVEGAEERGVVFVAGGAEVEAVAEDGGVAGGCVGFEPAPGGVVDEAIAGVVAG